MRAGMRPERRAVGTASRSAEKILAAARNRLQALQREVEAFLCDPDPDPEAVHRLHTMIRRLRAAYRHSRRYLRRGPAHRQQELERRLSAISRSVGALRDLDLRLHRVGEAPAGRESPAEKRRRGLLKGRLGDEARIGRELLKARLRAEEGLFEALGARTPMSSCRILPVPRETPGRILRAYRRARRRPDAERIHRLRILLREHRYLEEFLGSLPGPAPPPYPRSLNRLQQKLGRVHDLELLRAWMEREHPMDPDGEWGRTLRTELRAERRSLRVELRRRPVSGAIRARNA
ncbi:MAG: CHAD domain-containing protein [Thermoplasmata archaeon]